MRSVIILHGAWHRPAHFDAVSELLRRDAVDVVVPDLGGRSLQQNTQLVQDLVDGASEEPVIVAHSFGAVTATGLQHIAHLLFLNAFVFDAGETAAVWAEKIAQETGRAAATLPLVVDDQGQVRVELDRAREGLYADCADGPAERAVGLLRSEPGTIFADTPARAAWRTTPSTYVAGSDDKAMVPEMVAHFMRRCSTALTWPTSHSPYLSRPEDVASLIREHL